MNVKFNKVIAIIMFMFHIGIILPAQDIFDIARSSGMGRLEQSLDRASRERDVSRWQEISAEGMSSALAAWESATLYAKETDPVLWGQHRGVVEVQFRLTYEKKYALWLSNSFFEEKARIESSSIKTQLREAAANWKFLGKNGDTREVTTEDAGNAKQQWQETTSNAIVDGYIAKWADENGYRYQELRGILSEKGLSEADLAPAIEQRESEYSSYIRTEYERLAIIEQNKLMTTLLYDQNSLKRMSEKEAAKAIAARIAGETSSVTSEDMNMVFDALSTALDAQETDGIEINSEAWFASFRNAFENGLGKWEEAEKKFLVSRAEWEKTATEIYLDGEQSWADAYAELRTERKAWQKDIEKKFNDGIVKWESEQSSLDGLIAAARDEFVNAANEETNQIDQQVALQVSIYNQSRDMLDMSLQGLGLWYEVWGEKYNGVYSYWKTEDNQRIAGILAAVAVKDPINENEFSPDLKNTDPNILKKQMNTWKSLALEQLFEQTSKYLKNLESQLSTIPACIAANEQDITALYDISGSYGYYFNKDRISALRAQNDHLSAMALSLPSLIVAANAQKTKAADLLRKFSINEFSVTTTEITEILSSLGVSGYAEWDLYLPTFEAKTWQAADSFNSWLDKITESNANVTGALTMLYRITGTIFTNTTDRYFDELETELIKARAVKKYWADELEIATAVDEYARNNTSGQEWSTDTLTALDGAKTAYGAALNAYDVEVSKLDGLLAGCAMNQGLVEEAQQAMAIQKKHVEDARRAYSDTVLVFKNIGSEPIKQQISSLITAITKIWTDPTDTTESDTRLEYYKNAQQYAAKMADYEANEQIKHLVNGNASSSDVPEKLSFSELQIKGKDALGRVGNLTDQVKTAYVPAGYEELQSIMNRALTVIGDGGATAVEKAQAQKIVENGWRTVSAYWNNMIKQREAAVTLILTGKTGLESDALSVDQKSEKELRSWLKVNKELLTSQAMVESNTETKADFNACIKILTEMLDPDVPVDLYVALAEAKNSTPYFSEILNMHSPFESIISGYAMYLYALELDSQGITSSDIHSKTVNYYGSYSIQQSNERNVVARTNVAALISGTNIDDLIVGTTLDAYFMNLEKVGENLTIDGREALDNYISSIMEYKAASDVFDGQGSSISVRTAQDGYLEANKRFTAISSWLNQTSSLKSLFTMAQSLDFGEYASSDLVTSLSGAIASQIAVKIGAPDLIDCNTRQKAYNLLENSATLFDYTSFLSLSTVTKDAVADAIATIGESDKFGADPLVLEWFKLLEDDSSDPALKASRYMENPDVKAFFNASSLLDMEEQTENSITYLTDFAGYVYLTAGSLQADIDTILVQTDFAALIEASGKSASDVRKDIFFQISEEAKNYDLDGGIDFDAGEKLAFILNDIITDLKQSAPAATSPTDFTKSAIDNLIHTSRDAMIAAVRDELSSYVTVNNFSDLKTTLDELKGKNPEWLTDTWTPFFLAGAQMLGSHLLSSGYGAIQESLPYLNNLDESRANYVRDYQGFNEAINTYSYLLDGDPEAWIESYLDADGYELTAAVRERVVDAIRYGITIPDSVFTQTAYLSAVLNKKLVISSSSELNTKIMSAVDASRIGIQKSVYFIRYAQFAEAEIDNSRLSWINSVRARKIVDTSGLTQIEKDNINNLPTVAAILTRITGQAATHAEYFNSTSYSDLVSTLVSPDTDLAAILSRPDYSTEISYKTEENALNVVRQEYEQATHRDRSLQTDIYRNLMTLVDLDSDSSVKKAKMATAQDALLSAQTSYENSKVPYNTALTSLVSSYTLYNNQITVVQKAFDVAETAKKERQKKQEISDWASSVYLGNFGSNDEITYQTPKEKLSETQFAYRRADAAVTVLQALVGANDNPYQAEYRDGTDSVLEANLVQYKEGARQYYVARAVQYEAAQEIARMEDVVRKAERAERAAFEQLVNDNLKVKDIEDNDKLDMVCLIYDELTNSYNVSLRYTIEKNVVPPVGLYTYLDRFSLITEESQTTDEGLYSSYFIDKTETVITVDGTDDRTKAANDATIWLDGILSGPGINYLDNLGIASLFLRDLAAGKNPDNRKWLDEGNDFLEDSNFTIHGAPETIHTFDVHSHYRSAVRNQAASAYETIMLTAKGKADLAKYLLYRDTNLRSVLTVDREKKALESRAMNDVYSEIQSHENGYRIAARAAFVGAAAVSFWQPWVAVGLLIVGGVAEWTANAVRDVREKIGNVKNGVTNILNTGTKDKSDKLASWNAKKKDLEIKRANLDQYYGKAEGFLVYDSFKDSVLKILTTANGVATTADFTDIFTVHAFNASGAGSKIGTGTVEAIKLVITYLDTEKKRIKTVVETCGAKMKTAQAENLVELNKTISESMVIKAEDKALLSSLAAKASDLRLAVSDRKIASDSYDTLIAKYNSNAALEPTRKILTDIAQKTFGDGTWYQRRYDLMMAETEKVLIDTKVSHDRTSEGYTTDTIGSYIDSIHIALKHSQDSRLEIKQNEWALVQKQFQDKENEWLDQMNQIFALSNSEWNEAEGRINREYTTWQKDFQDEYAKKTNEWGTNYDSFLADKESWITGQFLYATNASNASLIDQSGANVDSVIAKTMSETLLDSNMEDRTFKSKGYIDTLLGKTSLAKLMAYTDSLQDRASGSAGIVRRGTAINASAYSAIASATAMLENITEDMRKSASVLAADQARRQFVIIKQEYKDRLIGENKGMSEWEESLVQSAGYNVSGTSISRSTVVGSTIAGSIKETQRVHSYQAFQAAEATISVSLDDNNLEGLDDYGIMTILGQAQSDLKTYGERIFGKTDADGVTKEWKIPRASSLAQIGDYERIESQDRTKNLVSEIEKKGEKKFYEMTDSEKENYGKLVNSLVTVRDGELGQHIGFAGEFKNGEDLNLDKSRSSNVKYQGKGEIGAIMLDFQWNDMQEGKGFGELGKAIYEQSLWDDRGMPFKAPTIRSVTEIAVAIAVSATVTVGTGGVGTGVAGVLMASVISASVNLADDLVFSGLDLIGGYKTPDQIGNELGGKLLTSAVSVGVGFGAGQLGGLAADKLTGGWKIAADMGIAGGSSAINTTAGAFANSYNFSNGSFDMKSFGNAMGSMNTWASTAGAMVGAGVSGGLSQLNLGDKAEKVFGFNSGQIGDMGTMNAFAGSMANAAVGYGMTGNATFNLARFKGIGLLEMSVGKNGITGQFGMGGTDISMGTIAATMRGVQNWGKNIDIEKAAKKNEMGNAATALRSQWGFGDAAGLAQLASILDGSTELRRGDENLGKETGQTVLENGKRVVTLNGYKENMTREEQMMMGITMQHEAYRDGVVTADNQIETLFAVTGHTNMAIRMAGDQRYANLMNTVIGSSSTLQNDIVNLMNARQAGADPNSFANYVGATYDSSKDYWRVLKNGDLYDDGLDDQISFEDGRETIKTGKGKQGTLEQYLGMEAGTGYSEILSKLDYGYEDGSWTIKQGKTISASMIQGLVDQGIVTNTDYNNPVAVAAYKQIGIYKDAAEKEEQRIKAIEREKQLQGTVYDKDTFLSQQDFEARYNTFPREKSCVTNGFIMGTAMMIGGLADPVLDKTVALAKEKGWMNPDGSLEKIDLFTRELLKASGKSGYISYAWDQETGNRISFKNEQSFKAAGYTYGRAVYNNRTTGREHSKLFYPGGYYDPLGERNYEGTYVLDRIEPFKWYN